MPGTRPAEATRLAGADDRAEAARLEADDGGGVDVPRSSAISSATIEKSSTGSGSSATASWMRCSAVRAARCGCVAEDGDDAGDEAELVAAREPAALEDDVGAVLAGVALRAVRG